MKLHGKPVAHSQAPIKHLIKSVAFNLTMCLIMILVIFLIPQLWGQLVQDCHPGSMENIPIVQVTPHLTLARAIAQGWPNRADDSVCQCLTHTQERKQGSCSHSNSLVKALASSGFVAG